MTTASTHHPKKFYAVSVRGKFDSAERSPEAGRHFKNADYLAADSALTEDVRKTIISRARYECSNNGYADGILQTLADAAIGTGPRLQLFVSDTADENLDEKVRRNLQRREMRWRKWTEGIGLTPKLKIARITKARDGEVFFRIGRNPKIKSHVKVTVNLYESEQVGDAINASLNPEFYGNGVLKHFDGISYDEYGNPTEYQFWKIHPGENGYLISGDSFDKFSAEYVIHYAHLMRPGQHRGLSEIASTLNIFNDLRRFTNAVLSAAETAAEISFLLSTNLDPESNGSQPAQSPIKFMDTVELVRNAGLALPEGWQANQLKAEHPTQTYDQFVDAKLSEAARPLSMPFNVAKGNSSSYNYASGRLDFQSYFKKIYAERGEIERLILNRLLEVFEQLDMIAFPGDYKYENEILHSWMWDGFEHVDPVKEATAQEKRLNNYTTTLSEECARDGKDYESVLRQRKREFDIMKRLKLPVPGSNAQQPVPAAPEEDPDGSENNKEE